MARPDDRLRRNPLFYFRCLADYAKLIPGAAALRGPGG